MSWFKKKTDAGRYNPAINAAITYLAAMHPDQVLSGIPRWFTKEGAYCPVPDMSNRHLFNILGYLRRIPSIGILERGEALAYLELNEPYNGFKVADGYYLTEEQINASLVSKAVFTDAICRMDGNAWVDILLDEAKFRKLTLPVKCQLPWASLIEHPLSADEYLNYNIGPVMKGEA